MSSGLHARPTGGCFPLSLGRQPASRSVLRSTRLRSPRSSALQPPFVPLSGCFAPSLVLSARIELRPPLPADRLPRSANEGYKALSASLPQTGRALAGDGPCRIAPLAQIGKRYARRFRHAAPSAPRPCGVPLRLVSSSQAPHPFASLTGSESSVVPLLVLLPSNPFRYAPLGFAGSPLAGTPPGRSASSPRPAQARGSTPGTSPGGHGSAQPGGPAQVPPCLARLRPPCRPSAPSVQFPCGGICLLILRPGADVHPRDPVSFTGPIHLSSHPRDSCPPGSARLPFSHTT